MGDVTGNFRWILAIISIALIGWGAGRVIADRDRYGLHFDTPIIDLGTITPTDILTVEVKVTNRSRSPVTVRRLASTCGCTTAVLSNRYIAPQDSVLLRVTTDASKISSHLINQSVSILAEERGRVKDEYAVPVVGRVDHSSTFRAIPSRVHVRVPRGGHSERTIELIGKKTSLESLPEVLDYAGGIAIIDTAYCENATAVESRSVRIRSAVDESHPLGLFEGKINIVSTGPVELSITIPITLEVVQPIRAIPQHIFVALTKPEESVDVCLAMTMHDRSTLPIDAIECDIPLCWRQMWDGDGRVAVNFTADKWPLGISQTYLTVTTDSGESVDIPIIVVRSERSERRTE